MSESKNVSRRGFLNQSLAVAGAAGAAAGIGADCRAQATAAESAPAAPSAAAKPDAIPCGIGNATISRMLLGGNLVFGYMHARDLKYVNRLFRAYATEENLISRSSRTASSSARNSAAPKTASAPGGHRSRRILIRNWNCLGVRFA